MRRAIGSILVFMVLFLASSTSGSIQPVNLLVNSTSGFTDARVVVVNSSNDVVYDEIFLSATTRTSATFYLWPNNTYYDEVFNYSVQVNQSGVWNWLNPLNNTLDYFGRGTLFDNITLPDFGANTKVYTNAAGLLLGGTDADTTYSAKADMGVLFTSEEVGLIETCDANEVLKWVASKWQCAADVDTNTQNTYNNGTGLDLASSTFSVKEEWINETIDNRLEGVVYNATVINTVDGTVDGGDIDSVSGFRDGNSYNLSELNNENFYTLANFTAVTDFDRLLLRAWYNADDDKKHNVHIGLWDWDDSIWDEEYAEIPYSDSFIVYVISVFDAERHVGTGGDVGIVRLRLLHDDEGDKGRAEHEFYIDYAVLVDGYSVLTSTAVPPLQQVVDAGPYLTSNVFTAGNVTFGNLSNVIFDDNMTLTNGSGAGYIGTTTANNQLSYVTVQDNINELSWKQEGYDNQTWFHKVESMNYNDDEDIYPLLPDIGDYYIVASGESTWWDDNWNERIKFEVNDEILDNVVDGIPITIIINGSHRLFSGGQSDASEQIFVQYIGGVPFILQHYHEYWDYAANISVYKIAPLLLQDDTEIHLYFNSTNTGVPSSDAPFQNLLHYYEMNNTLGGIDRSPNGNDYYQKVGTMYDEDGDHGQGTNYTTSNAYWAMDCSSCWWELGYQYRTWSHHFRTDNDVTTRQVIFGEGGGTNGIVLVVEGSEIWYHLWSKSTGWEDGMANATMTGVTANTDYYVTIAYGCNGGDILNCDDGDDGNTTLYVNGQEIATNNSMAWMNAHSGNGAIGEEGGNTKLLRNGASFSGAPFDGGIYESMTQEEEWNYDEHRAWFHSINGSLWTATVESPSGAVNQFEGHDQKLARYAGIGQGETEFNWTMSEPFDGITVRVLDLGASIWSYVGEYPDGYWAPSSGGTGRHNDMVEKQGGNDDTDEFFHLEEVWYDAASRVASGADIGLVPSGKVDIWDEGYAQSVLLVETDKGVYTHSDRILKIRGDGNIVTDFDSADSITYINGSRLFTWDGPQIDLGNVSFADQALLKASTVTFGTLLITGDLRVQDFSSNENVTATKYLFGDLTYATGVPGLGGLNTTLWQDDGTHTSSNITINSGDVKASGDIAFMSEIKPDNTVCSNGEILKKNAADDWNCAADATGAGGSNNMTYVATYMDVGGGAGNGVLSGLILSGNTITPPTTNLGFPRNLNWTFACIGFPGDTDTLTLKINGTDADGVYVEETDNSINPSVGTDYGNTGDVAFAIVHNITITGWAGTCQMGMSMTIGKEDKLGVGNYPLASSSEVFKTTKAARYLTVPTVDSTYGTIDFSPITTGDDITIFYRT